MCAVIDPPLFIPITNAKDKRHADFGILKDWLDTGVGKAVIGGTKYRDELRKVASVLPFLVELEKKGKIVKIAEGDADQAARFAVKAANSGNFDDEHLVGLVACTGCKIVCLDDPRAHSFLKNPALYPQKTKLPKLFTSVKNASLLSQKYLAPCCK